MGKWSNLRMVVCSVGRVGGLNFKKFVSWVNGQTFEWSCGRSVEWADWSLRNLFYGQMVKPSNGRVVGRSSGWIEVEICFMGKWSNHRMVVWSVGRVGGLKYKKLVSWVNGQTFEWSCGRSVEWTDWILRSWYWWMVKWGCLWNRCSDGKPKLNDSMGKWRFSLTLWPIFFKIISQFLHFKFVFLKSLLC